MPPRNRISIPDDISQRVTVPSNDRVLAPIPIDRLRRLHRHLVSALLASQAVPGQRDIPSSGKPEPVGFAARVAGAACALCKGSCCGGGDDDAFLSETTMTRVRQAKPELELLEVANLYVQRVPDIGYEGSCIFHGERGCTLDRSLRSDVCNNFFCGPLGAYLKTGTATPVSIIAGEGDTMRRSPVLRPGQ
jgi:hypothetical protein